MKLIQVYDPPMCCSSGVCGPDIDPILPRFAGLLAQLQGRGVEIQRFNLAQQPVEFARNPAVRAALEADGTAALPLIFVDGRVALKGRYPDQPERAELMRRARTESEKPAAV
jgi:hypothetical protein